MYLTNDIYELEKTNGNIIGPNGLVKYCYQTEEFIIIEELQWGEGYEISIDNSENLNCIKINKKDKTKNKLGMYLGMPKEQALNKINIHDDNDKIYIIYSEEKEANIYTYVELEFKKNELTKLSVFTVTFIAQICNS